MLVHSVAASSRAARRARPRAFAPRFRATKKVTASLQIEQKAANIIIRTFGILVYSIISPHCYTQMNA